MRGDYALFFGPWLQKPLQIAVVIPGSGRLTKVMAELVDLDRPGPVLELGAGTGGITRGLLQAGCPRDRLIALKRAPSLAAALPRRFPGIATIVGDATALTGHFARFAVDRLCAVVSILPIKWFPVAVQRAIVEPWPRAPGAGRRLFADDQRFRVADRDRLARSGWQAGRLCLAEPAVCPGLGLFLAGRR
jgi:phosphatidylethanolamine/phosphatidyl-N-methylethanolamine N-methyltransferase